ncbi:MAG TPA: nuclease-related domain-containing protein, partial [Acidimicrobiales bacterium]
AERAVSARRVAERRQREADKAARIADAWEAGSAGEVRLAAVLEELVADECRHLPDRRRPGSTGNVDHIVVTPSAVFVVDAKKWTGTIDVDENGVLRQDGRSRARELEAARNTAVAVATVLDRVLGDQKVDVRPALCFVGEARIGDARFVDRVKLVDIDDVLGWIRVWPRKLSAEQMERVCVQLLHDFPAKVSDDVADVPIVEPEEQVVYLKPWKRQRMHRLYVQSNEGGDVGYLDLASGRVVTTSAEWDDVLAQLLPHYAWGDSPGTTKADMTADAKGALRRFIDALLRRPAPTPERSIIACYRWRGHGKDRLYLSRILPGGQKRELGFFDLHTGKLRPDDDALGSTAVLGYCGQRFQQLELEHERAALPD